MVQAVLLIRNMKLEAPLLKQKTKTNKGVAQLRLYSWASSLCFSHEKKMGVVERKPLIL